MENTKLLVSTNNKKGILLESKEEGLSISVWKKETPIATELSEDQAIELCKFISESFPSSRNYQEEEKQIQSWIERIDLANNNWKPLKEGGEEGEEEK